VEERRFSAAKGIRKETPSLAPQARAQRSGALEFEPHEEARTISKGNYSGAGW
jgi:hypothetical protein